MSHSVRPFVSAAIFLITQAAVSTTAVQARSQCGPDLLVVDDGTGIANELIISEIAPGEHIEIYNTTALPIALDAGSHELCSPFQYAKLRDLLPGVVVPAGASVVVPWPPAFVDTDAGGEVILYSQPPFATSTNIMDFVCWGANPHPSRKGQAESVGKWVGGCVAVLASGAVHRLAATDGVDLADYRDQVPSPTECFLFADSFETGDTTAWTQTIP